LGAVPYLPDESTPGKLLRNTHLHSCFGVMQQLGFRGEYKIRTPDSRFATLALNVENVDLVLAAMDSISSDTIFPRRPNVAYRFNNYIKWAIKVLSRLSIDLSDLMRDPDLRNHGLGIHNYHLVFMRSMRDKSFHALRLIFCSSTRRALTSLCYRIERIENASRLNGWDSVPLGDMEEYQKFLEIIRTIPVDISQIKELLQGVGSDIQQSFGQIYISTSEQRLSNRRSAELDLLLGSRVYLPFAMALKQLATSGFLSEGGYPHQTYPSLWKLPRDPRPEELQGPETIGTAALLSAREQQNIHVNVVGFVDTIFLPNIPGRWKRCVRCASIMENIRYEANHYLSLNTANLKKCPCGGSWELLLGG